MNKWNILKSAAIEELITVSKFILNSLRRIMGLEKERIHTKEFNDHDFLFGTWSDEEYESFEKTQEDFQKIDTDMWE